MSTLKFASDLFLGKQELQRMIDSIDINGYKKTLLSDSYSFGIIKNQDDVAFVNYKVESGSNSGTIKIANDSFAIDKFGQLIYKIAEDNIVLPSDNNWYWIKIKYLKSVLESGSVSIDTQGNLTGVNTKFTEILRGQPNRPSKIKFVDGSLNTQEYIVQEVINDTSAVLLGVFASESNLHYAVVGSFTEGIDVPTIDKYPFQYDGIIPLTIGNGLILETVLNTAPSKISGEEFYIARVKWSGSTLLIEDKRIEFWQSKADYKLSFFNKIDNPLIGVESIKFDNQYSTLNHNQITIGWGMRSSNWVINSELRRITILSCIESGKYKTVANFTNGNFDRWRLYAKNGSYKIIVNSSLSGGQINLILDSLNPDDYIATDELVIVPDVEEIQLKFKQDAAEFVIDDIESVFRFPIRQGYAIIKILVPINTGIYKYHISYSYKNFADYDIWRILPTDSVNGYYDEASFDINGTLKVNPVDRTRKTYVSDNVNGYIEFISNGSNYYNIVSRLTRGDTYGVQHVNLSDADNNPIYSLAVGTSKQVQIFDGTDSLGVDWFIVLNDGSQEENEFYLDFRNIITLNTFHLRIVENYVSTSVYDLLMNFNTFDISQAAASNLLIKCVWDGTHWKIFKHISASPSVDITGKADKVTGATNGNFAGLDVNGNLTDSGHKHSDYDVAGAASTLVGGLVSALGDAAYKDTGITAGTVAAGDDSRFEKATDIIPVGATTFTLKKKVFEIGDWDMQSAATKTIATGITTLNIRSVSVLIRSDSGINTTYPLNHADNLGLHGSFYFSNESGSLVLGRIDTGMFNSADFNSTGYMRGYVTIEYVDGTF